MIGRIAGRLLEKNPPMILVDVHGVGYEIAVPMSTFYNLPEVGAETVLLTHFIVREDAQLLYGFLTAAERSAFRELIKVSGIGPRTALSVLSGLSVEALTQALTAQDSAMLTRIPGIGKKTAERLAAGSKADIVSALVALGYSEREAAAAARKLPEDISVSDGIREALRGMAK